MSAPPPIAFGGRLCNPAVGELANADQWVCWRPVQRKGKLSKCPFTPAGSPASSTDPRTWSSFNECFVAAFVDGRHAGIGRVLTRDDGLVGIDLDDAIASDGAVAPWALKAVGGVPSYWERSPGGAGLHSWVRGTWPTTGNKRGSIEVYAVKRYLTVTGDHLPGTPDRICAVGLDHLREHFAQGAPCKTPTPLNLPEPLADADVRRFARTYPQLRRILEGHYPSASERDLALCRFSKLAGWEQEKAWGLVRAVRTDGKADRSDYAAHTLSIVGY